MPTRYLDGHAPLGCQRGVALVMALVFLLLITMLAVSSSGQSLLQVRMAGGFRNAQQARMSAETALRGAEYTLWSTASRLGGHLACLDGGISLGDGCIVYNPHAAAYKAGGAVATFLSAPGWVDGIGVAYDGYGRSGTAEGESTAKLYKRPRYIIEDLGPERPEGTGSMRESGNSGPGSGGPGQLDIHVYRITARATGGNPNGTSVVQSTFVAPSGR